MSLTNWRSIKYGFGLNIMMLLVILCFARASQQTPASGPCLPPDPTPCFPKVDLLFLVDVSDSMNTYYNMTRDFAKAVVNSQIPQDTRVAMVVFSGCKHPIEPGCSLSRNLTCSQTLGSASRGTNPPSAVRTLWNFSAGANISAAKVEFGEYNIPRTVESAGNLGGCTATDFGLERAVEIMNKSSVPGRKKIIIVITDGTPNPLNFTSCILSSYSSPSLTAFKNDMNGILAVVPLGPFIVPAHLHKYLLCMATLDKNNVPLVFTVPKYLELMTRVSELAAVVCTNTKRTCTPNPSQSPTRNPSVGPTVSPVTSQPSLQPSLTPTRQPITSRPSGAPTTPFPSNQPSTGPTMRPSLYPTSSSPTSLPSQQPTTKPSLKPSDTPTGSPTVPCHKNGSRVEIEIEVEKESEVEVPLIVFVSLLSVCTAVCWGYILMGCWNRKPPTCPCWAWLGFGVYPVIIGDEESEESDDKPDFPETPLIDGGSYEVEMYEEERVSTDVYVVGGDEDGAASGGIGGGVTVGVGAVEVDADNDQMTEKRRLRGDARRRRGDDGDGVGARRGDGGEDSDSRSREVDE